MKLALIASLLWGLAGAVLYCGSVWGVVPLLLGVFFGYKCLEHVYSSSTAKPDPKHRLFVYYLGGGAFILLGLVLIVIRIGLGSFLAPILPGPEGSVGGMVIAASWFASVPIFLFGAYNIYVARKLAKMSP